MLILKGISGIFIQSIVLREIFSNFFGNELFFCLVISFYLSGGAMGSFILSKSRNWQKDYIFFTILEIFILPIFIYFLRISTNILQAYYFSNIKFLILSFFLSFSSGFFEGCRFILLSFIYRYEKSSGKVYGLEGIGFLIGGFLFYLLLFFKKDIFFLLFFSFLLNISTIFYFRKNFAFIFGLFILSLFPFSNKIEFKTVEKKYKVFNLIEIRETFFNKLTILKKENQYILLSNGFQEWSTQPDYFSIKNIVYFSLAFCKDLKKVGIYGNPEILEEIKKYKVPEIYFFEIDKEKFKFIKEYQLKSGSKNIYFYDNLTRFLKENKIKFDVFIITSSLPMTMRENYFLTEDFFREIKDFTETISIVLPGTYDYLGEILLNLHSSIYKTGKKYFVNELLVFTYPMIIIFSNSELKLKKMLLTDKEFFNESYLNFVTDENKKSKYLEKILNTPSHINTISNQFSLYTSIAFYFSQFSQKTGKILIKFFSFLYKLKDFLPIIFLLIFLILLLPSFSPYSTIIFTNGFSSFTFETIFIYLFQIYFGFIYGFISGIIGIFMAGLSSGSLISILRIHSKKTLFYSEILHFLFYAFSFLLILNGNLPIYLIFISGFLTGWEFGIISFLVKKKSIIETTGKLYSIDLIGALFSALLLPILFIPIFGILGCILLLVFLKFSNLFKIYFY